MQVATQHYVFLCFIFRVKVDNFTFPINAEYTRKKIKFFWEALFQSCTLYMKVFIIKIGPDITFILPLPIALKMM